MKTLKWGIIAPGKIAQKFAFDLQLVEHNTLYAVASRNIEKATLFASKYGAKKAYGSYDELLNDEQVDVVYIANPHPFHAESTIKTLNAGKHVLCEKPLGINKLEVQSIISASTANNRFMMEALWSRFNPNIIACLDKIREGDIGNPNHLTADFTFSGNHSNEGRLLNIDLAGGSLLDVGIYPVFLSYLIFGKPKSIKAHGILHKTTGVDTHFSASLLYDNAIAQISSNIMSQSDMVAKIAGTKGAIYIDSRWHEAEGHTIQIEEKKVHYKVPKIGHGYCHEIIDCANCIRSGKIQSALWSHQNSIDLISILDEIRAQIGLKYPFE
ncbi:MAG: Gfo/Idh/MocA family oxidoreductase [Saprospiraceae bacterium]